MAQTGYTPIQLYRTTTSGAAPLAANLQQGELAININDADMALYAENASGTVKRLMNNPAGLKYPTADGTNGQVIKTDGSGNLSWTAGASGSYLPLTGGTMTGAITFAAGQTVANLAAGSAGTIPYQSSSGTTAMLSAGTSGQVLTSGGAGAPTWSAVAGGNLKSQEFTSSGTWTKPANVSEVFVTLVGGGASGRGGTTTYGGAGGGAGAYLQANLTVTGNLTVTIGAGGTGDSTTGNSGGASSISGGASLTAGGGAKYNTTPTDGASSTGLQAATAVSIPGSYTQYGSGNAGGQGQSYNPYAQGGGGGGAGGPGGTGSTYNSSSGILLWNGHGDGGAGRGGKAGGGGAGYMTGDGAAFGSGSCGGGKGGNSTGVNGFSAEANSGSGGGGGGTATSGTTSGGNGGSGYCLIQWVE
jgi:hypothetical protein